MMEYDLRYYAKGTAFSENHFDLRKMELLVSGYRSITDKLIAVQLGRRQLTPAIKKQIDYNVQINPGSIEFLIDFVFTNKELLGALASDGGYQLSGVITRLLRSAIDLRKEVSDSIKKGLPITININTALNIGSGLSIANSGDGRITINDPKILWAAQTTKYPVDRLIGGVDGESIEYIELGPEKEAIKITTKDRSILGQNREELTATLNILGRLDMVAFSSHRGIIISEGERFPVTWDDGIRSKMHSMADTQGIEFTVRPIIDKQKLHSDAIGYHVLDCRDPQANFDM